MADAWQGRCCGYLLEIILLFVMVGLSLTVVITIALLKSDYDGECPLYPVVEEDPFFNFDTVDVSNCNYIIGANSACAGVSFFTLIYVSIELARNKRIFLIMPLIKIVVFVIMLVLLAVSAGIVTAGFAAICSSLEPIYEYLYPTCKSWQLYGWVYYGYDGSHFYDYLFAAQIASWLGTLVMAVLAILSCIIQACCTSRHIDGDDKRTLVI